MPDSLEPNTATALLSLLVLVEVVGLALYDLHHKRLPNWVSLPMLLAGQILNFPGSLETWLGCLLLFLGWRARFIGAGDAKLWMALLWLAPRSEGMTALLVMGTLLYSTALAQLAWRKLHGGIRLVGRRTPAAWRTIPFALWLAVISIK